MSAQARLFSRGGGKRKRNGFGWKKGTDQKVKALGRFGERLVQHVLGGVLSEEKDEVCDLWLDELDVGIESKVGSDRDGVRVRIDQLESHLELARAGFPYSRYWYAFLKYRNWGRDNNGQRCRLFQEMVRSESDVPNFLGKNIIGLYVLDISVVDAIRDRQKTVMVYRRSGRTSATSINWRFFDQLKSEPEETLRTLGLKRSGYRLHSSDVKISFAGCRMEFEFLTLLKDGFSPKRPANLFQLGFTGLEKAVGL